MRSELTAERPSKRMCDVVPSSSASPTATRPASSSPADVSDEARAAVPQHVLTRALAVEPDIDVDTLHDESAMPRRSHVLPR